MPRYLLALLALLGAQNALAGQVLVSQPTFAGYSDPLDFGQSFTAPAAALLEAIRFPIVSSLGGTEITVSLHRFDRNTPVLDPAVLSVGVVPEASIPSSPNWIEVAMSPAPLVAGETYAFFIAATDPGGSTGWNNYGTAVQDVYSGGEFFHLHAFEGQVSFSNLREMAFEIVVVPEPGTLVLALIGACVGFLASKRRKGVHGKVQ